MTIPNPNPTLPPAMPSPVSRTVAVIGAGAAGLCAALELRREGHTVVVYERGSNIGGTWAYTPETESDPIGIEPTRKVVHSSLYASLRTNLPREVMGFRAYPFVACRKPGRDPRRFPGHAEVLEYLRDFALEFGLEEMVRFGREVRHVGRIEDRKWKVSSKKRGGEEDGDDEVYDAVVVCNGHYSEPRIAEIPAAFNSLWISILWENVWGGEVYDAGEEDGDDEVYDAVVVCNGHYSEPRIAEIPGIEEWPGKQIHSHNYRVPDPFRDQVVIVIGSSASAEDISRDIARVAKQVHIASRSEVNGVVRKLPGHDNVWVHSMINSVRKDGAVVFGDGNEIFADVILHCTGYKYHFPFLETNGIVSVEDNRVGPLYQHIFPPTLAPWLSFVGLPWKVVPFPQFEFQSKWIAGVLSGRIPLESTEEMIADTEAFYSSLEAAGVPTRYTHQMGESQFEYNDWLAAKSGSPPSEEWRKQMYLVTGRRKRSSPETYRNQWEDEDLMSLAYQDFKSIPVVSA